MSDDNEFVVVCDTREKLPYEFSADVQMVREKLDTGDYSVKGFEDVFAVERKSLPDLLNSITWERDRFKREVERGDDFLAFVVIVEAPVKEIMEWNYERKVHPNSVMGTVNNWEKYHNVEFVWAKDRHEAKEATLRLLQRWYDAYQSLYE